jgi:tubulin polyglutamylase TTLL4
MFNKRPPTIFFPYPAFLKMKRPYEGEDRLIKMTQDELKPFSTLGFKINSSTHTYNCVVNSLKTAGFRLVNGSIWNVLWTGIIKPNRLKLLNQYQKINHFPGCWHLGRKDNLWRNVFKMKRQHG